MSSFVYNRPWLPDYQIRIIDAPERYTVTEATTKAGKTVSHIIWQYEQCLQGKKGHNHWWVAPVSLQAEIAYNRLRNYIPAKSPFRWNDTYKTILYPNGAVHWFKSGEKPDNLYGEDVYSAVLDEFTRMREESWFAIRSTLTATRGKCKFIGNVKGVQNWGYQLARKAESGSMKDWSYFKITADDAVKAGILHQEEIDDAKATLPTGVFLELYYGIPFQNSANKFCYAFDEKKHVKKCSVNFNYPIYLSFDFNRNPICVNIIQWYDKKIRVPYVIKLENSNIYRLCDYIQNLFIGKNPLYIVNGDASGKNRSAMVEDDLNYFLIIKKKLGLSVNQMQQLPNNPLLKENQVLVNAILEHYDVEIDPDNAAPLIFDCKFVEFLPDGSIKKGDREDPTQQADALDGFRYFLNRNLRNFVKASL